MPKFDCIERPLSRFFDHYGQFISRNPIPFIIFPLLITGFCSLGFLQLDPITDAIYLFTPTGAPSKMERQAIHDLWPLTNGSYIPGRAVTQSREVQLTVRTRDDGNILDKPYSEAIYRLDQFIQNKINVTFEGKVYRYKDLCLQWKGEGCPGVKHIHVISDLYQHGFNITYPTLRVGQVYVFDFFSVTHGHVGGGWGCPQKVYYVLCEPFSRLVRGIMWYKKNFQRLLAGNPFLPAPPSMPKTGYIGSSLGGVSIGHGKHNESIVASASAWLMVYHLQFYPHDVLFISGIWEKAFQKALEEYPEDPYIELTYFHSQSLAEELKRNADSLIPRFVVAFTILMIFSVICSMSLIDGTLFVDWALSKPLLSVLGVVNAGMGIATAVGALNLAGVPYNDIVGVMPFLVVAVGTDNMFLMVAAVRRTNRAHPAETRVGECMSDAAISMFITSLTDAFSFGVGTITSIPAVQIFCFYTCAAITFTFLYQITFFTAWLSLAIKWEAEGRHCVFLKHTIPSTYKDESSYFKKIFALGSRPHKDVDNLSVNQKESVVAMFFQKWYAPVLMEPIVRVMTIFWYCVYMGFGIYGCLQLREGLEPVNLLVEDSYAIPHYKVLEHYFWHYGASVQIVVNNATDLRDPLERDGIRAMIRTFANSKHTIGDESIQFWMNEMDRYYSEEIKINYTTTMFYEAAKHFFAAKKTEYWPEDVKWGKLEDGTFGIVAFRFLVGLRDIATTVQQQETVAQMREMASRYPQYNITTFMPLWLFTDQYDIVVPNTVQNVGIAMLVMIIIALLLIPQPMCAVWVTASIASIDIGVVGYMTLWGVNLDAISMITIIMSIGFSVDYSAHITYGYVISKEKLPSDRISEALGALGWPLTQGAISTILAVIVLADVPAYMIVTFFKTVFLSITIGLLHGLVFLPVTLSLCVRGFCAISSGSDGDEEDDNETKDVCSVILP